MDSQSSFTPTEAPLLSLLTCVTMLDPSTKIRIGQVLPICLNILRLGGLFMFRILIQPFKGPEAPTMPLPLTTSPIIT